VPSEASHTYETPGVYQVVVDLVDEDGIHAAAGTLEVRVRPDRLLSIPSVQGSRFEFVVVPVAVDIGDEIAGVELVIGYDPDLFFPLLVINGELLSGFTGTVDFSTAGLIVVSLSSSDPIPDGATNVTLVQIVFFVLSKDSGPIDLQSASLVTLDGAELALEVTPQAGADATDGEIVVLKSNNGRGKGRPDSADAQASTVILTEEDSSGSQVSGMAVMESSELLSVEPTGSGFEPASPDASVQNLDGDSGQAIEDALPVPGDGLSGEAETTPSPSDLWWEDARESSVPGWNGSYDMPFDWTRTFVTTAPRTLLPRYLV
jgi:hypothetical protein